MWVQYIGPSAVPVRIITARRDLFAVPGKPVEVPDDVGAGLIEQRRVWVTVEAPAAEPSVAEASAPVEEPPASGPADAGTPPKGRGRKAAAEPAADGPTDVGTPDEEVN